jgi:hypothetical protein
VHFQGVKSGLNSVPCLIKNSDATRDLVLTSPVSAGILGLAIMELWTVSTAYTEELLNKLFVDD